MRYNMDFLVAALIFLIVLWHHFMKQRQYAGNKTEKTFQIFMMLGIGDILLDMVSTVVIDNSRPEFARMLYVILLLFYLCQLLIPPVLYLYTLALAGGAVAATYPLCRWSIIWGMPPTLKPTQGMPHAIASTMVLGRLSCKEGVTYRSTAL